MPTQIQVTAVTSFTYSDSNRYGYNLKVNIPSVLSEDTRYYDVTPEIRSERRLFGSPLNTRKIVIPPVPIVIPPGPILVPGTPGPEFEYKTQASGFNTQAQADNAAAIARNDMELLLADVSVLNLSVGTPIITTYLFP
jgi:hypothetical protein